MDPAHLEVPASAYQLVNSGIGGSFPQARLSVCAGTGPFLYVNVSLTFHSRALALECEEYDVERPLKVVGVEMVAVVVGVAAARTL